MSLTRSELVAQSCPDTAARLVLNPEADTANAWAILCRALGYTEAISALIDEGASPAFLARLPRYEQST